jgi:hypothetical protein
METQSSNKVAMIRANNIQILVDSSSHIDQTVVSLCIMTPSIKTIFLFNQQFLLYMRLITLNIEHEKLPKS